MVAAKHIRIKFFTLMHRNHILTIKHKAAVHLPSSNNDCLRKMTVLLTQVEEWAERHGALYNTRYIRSKTPRKSHPENVTEP